ncbi:MAG: ATP-grasp ribosomal peptide maturase [Pseudonocardiaceae bacterium]
MPTGATVLVLTGPDDPTADAVITALAAHPVRVARMDTGDFPARMRLSATNLGKGWTGQLCTDHVTVELEQVRSMYYRRPTRFTFPGGMSEADRVYGAVEARMGLGGVLSALDCLYVNHPHTAARAEYKPLQQAVAAQAGLTMPATLIGNDHAAAVVFAEAVPGPVVCKSLSSLVLGDESGAPLITYTTRVAVDDIDPDAFAATAHFLQSWVDKAWEARVTMVGRRPYGVAIHADSPAARVDWRADYGALRYSPIEPPAEVTAAMVRYLDLFGLSFGAFDFGITGDGQWLAYECNPGAQWLWLEHQTSIGIGISVALAELLAAGATR